MRIIGKAIDAEAAALDATGLATGLIGDAIAANMLLLGFAWQRGLVPVSLDALMTAIELNGVAVAMNKSAFALGRLAAHEPGSARLKTAETVDRGDGGFRGEAPQPRCDLSPPTRTLAMHTGSWNWSRRAGAAEERFRAWPVRLCRCRSG